METVPVVGVSFGVGVVGGGGEEGRRSSSSHHHRHSSTTAAAAAAANTGGAIYPVDDHGISLGGPRWFLRTTNDGLSQQANASAQPYISSRSQAEIP